MKYRHLIYVFSDLIITFVMVMLSFFTFIFRLDPGLSSTQWNAMWIYISSITLVTVIVFFLFRIYDIATTYFSLYDSLKIGIITLFINVIGLIVLKCIPTDIIYAPSAASWVLTTFALMLLYCGTRFIVRGINIVFAIQKRIHGRRTIIIGAGGACKVALDELRNNPRLHNRVVAIVDDNPSLIGTRYSNVKIIGPISNIINIVRGFEAEEVIIAICNITSERLKEIISLLEPLPVRIKRLPIVGEMVGPHDEKILNVNVDDLLERKKVELDTVGLSSMIEDKIIMVTGAGGSIGSELCRQIFKYGPKELILFDIYENSTYEIEQELKTLQRKSPEYKTIIHTRIGSTYNEHTVESVISTYKPSIIYHAAAYKHVPLMEDSPKEAIRTNILGTYNVAKIAEKYHVEKMLLVSTDKAVRPTNVMGATKRYAELVMQYFAEHSKFTKYCMVRFGNVLGSNGSVVPLFTKQIEAGGPVTVTDVDVIRYFMSIPEAVGLILNSSLLSKNGEIFILDMGTPIHITTLAERMIRQAGLIPYKDIEIIYTGLRPGEKLFEELLLDKEKHKKTSNGLIFIEEPLKGIDVKKILSVSSLLDIEDKTKVKEELIKNLR